MTHPSRTKHEVEQLGSFWFYVGLLGMSLLSLKAVYDVDGWGFGVVYWSFFVLYVWYYWYYTHRKTS